MFYHTSSLYHCSFVNSRIRKGRQSSRGFGRSKGCRHRLPPEISEVKGGFLVVRPLIVDFLRPGFDSGAIRAAQSMKPASWLVF